MTREPKRADVVARAVQQALTASAGLHAMGMQRRADGIAAAAERLLAQDRPGASELRAALLRSTGLSAPMIEWGLTSTLTSLNAEALRSLGADANGEGPRDLVAVILSANVFTAPLRAMVLPLLIGAPVVCKASSRDDVMAHAFADALRSVDRELGDALQVVTFGRDDPDALQALVARAARVSVYGDDDSIAYIASAVPPGARLSPHGQGVGAIYLPWQCLRTPREALLVARRIAIDVSAYDQRGCLSPHFVLVQSGGAVDAAALAELLHQPSMVELEKLLPRGPLTGPNNAQQMQWRGVASARGTLFKGAAHSVSHEGRNPLRLSPGYRNIGVYDCNSAAMCAELLLPFEQHLKAMAVGGDPDARTELADALEPATPHLCQIGTLQSPQLDAPVDGQPPLSGLR